MKVDVNLLKHTCDVRNASRFKPTMKVNAAMIKKIIGA